MKKEEILKEFEEKFVVTEMAMDEDKIEDERIIADYIDGELLRAKDIMDWLRTTLDSYDHHLREEMEQKINTLKRYSGNHNAEHTWVTDGYCHACRKNLTEQQLEEQFGYNEALSDASELIRKKV